jgi:hypothetical protein
MSKVHPQAWFANNAHLSEDVKMIHSLSSTPSLHSFTPVFLENKFHLEIFIPWHSSLSAKIWPANSY